jgi:hypothetical protein
VKLGSLRTPSALAVEVLWSFAAAALFVQFFGQGDGPAPSILAVAAVVLASFALARVLPSSSTSDDSAGAGVAMSMAALAVIGLLTYNRPPWDIGWLADVATDLRAVIQPNGHVIAGMVAFIALWIRGVRRGSLPELDLDDAIFSVSVGFVPVVIAALSTPDVQVDISWGAFAFAYGIVALATLGVFNASPSVELSSMTTGWPLAIGVLAAVALAFALVAGTVDRDVFDVLSPLVAPVEAVGRLLRDYVLMPIFWVIALPFRLFVWVLDALAPNSEQMRRPPQPPMEEPPKDEGDTPLWWRVLVAIGLSVSGALIALLALWLLWRSFRRYVGRRAAGIGEDRENVEPASSLLGDLGSMLGALGQRFRRDRGAPNSVAIRRLYFEVLAAAEDRGLPRPVSATPSRFAASLDASFGSDLASKISAAFVESRYGERALDDERVRLLREKWRTEREQS